MNGQLRGKRGGVVYYRANGQQISRARNFNPSNPNTNKQLYQRAIMATTMQIYSAGKMIFDHAFQGKKRGNENQSRFLSVNSKLIREGIAAQASAEEDNFIRVIGPGVTMPTPNPVQVSEGTYQNTQLDSMGVLLKQATAGQTIADYCAKAGLIEGDIFTWVVLEAGNAVAYIAPNAGENVRGQQFVTKFNYCQVRVKAGATSDSTEISANTEYSAIFEAAERSTLEPQLDAKLIGAAGLFTADILDYGLAKACVGVIRSRTDMDLRSTTILEPATLNEGEYGLSSAFLLNAWSAGTVAVGNSELILEGSDF